MKILGRRLRILAFLVAVALAPGAARGVVKITRGPYLQSLLGTSAVVVWKTEGESAGGIRWTGPDGLAHSAGEGPPSLQHKVAITDLIP